MPVETVAAWTQFDPEKALGDTVVVIDLLRATSTIVTALSSNASEVIPAASRAEARSLAHPGDILAGERGGLPIPGFDLSNSPRDVATAQVAGRRVILTTTNGTRAIRQVEGMQKVLLLSLLNVSAVADALAGTAELTILCAGTDGRASLDDLLAAGALLHRLDLEPDDLGRAARELYLAHRQDLAGYLASCSHGLKMRKLGLDADLIFCCQEDLFPLVPRYAKGVIRKELP